ncbi:zinc finger protein [Babesia duncani]|uniref:Zinc finger protein n=1 Tax=Babesia duncani TaxID=323732 RepID=A0AAD9PJJ2_9APIC|nr:zinc finger protein [Babesia duncani]
MAPQTKPSRPHAISLSSLKGLSGDYCCVCSESLGTKQKGVILCHCCSQGAHLHCCLPLNSEPGLYRICNICSKLRNSFNYPEH